MIIKLNYLLILIFIIILVYENIYLNYLFHDVKKLLCCDMFTFPNCYLQAFVLILCGPNTEEPRPVDTPLLWTTHNCGHFSPDLFGFPYINNG